MSDSLRFEQSQLVSLVGHPLRSELGTQFSFGTDANVLRLVSQLSPETVHGFIYTPGPALYLAIEMSDVSFLDFAGVGALVHLFVSRRDHGKKLALAALAPRTVAVLQVAGWMGALPIHASLEVATQQSDF